MKFQISNFKLQIRQGYTLIELMVVLAIMGFIAAIAFYGLRSYNNAQQVVNAQKDFINNLRSLQNKVTNGADGSNIKEFPVNSVSGVTITPSGISVCFVNSNYTGNYTSTYSCGGCISGSGFICNGVTASSPSPYQEFSFTNGSITKHVRIEGSGMTINRIYASD